MTAEQLQSELAQVQVLRHLTYPALRRIVQTGRLTEAKNGQLVIGPGFGSRGFFVILSGSVSVQMSNGVILGYLGPKQYFGEIALLEGVDRTACCRANADSVLLEIPPQTFHADLASNPMVKAGMLATVKLRRMVQEKVKSASAAGVNVGAGAIPRPTAPAPGGLGAVPRPTVPGAPGLPPRPAVPPVPGAVPRPTIPGIPPRPSALSPRLGPVFATA